MKQVNKETNNNLFEIIDSDPSIGLSEEQVKQMKSYGLVNKMPKAVTKSYFKIFFDNIFNFFNIILFGVALFMIITTVTGFSDESQRVSAGDFVFAYLLLVNIAIGLFQDIKARIKVDKLRVISYPTVKVIRDGITIEIPGNEVVLNDILLLKSGDQIICDSILLDGNLEVNESLLTGESLNIVKHKGDYIYSGSYITSGSATVRVDKVGKYNFAASLQNKAKKFKRPKSEILRSINKIFVLIGIILVVLASAMLATYLIRGTFQSNTLNFTGSIVAMVPIGMFLLVSLTLAVGVIRLAKRRMLVQELYCIETLARVDTLCLDKTGTITDGTMSLKHLDILSNDSKSDIDNILSTLVRATKDDNSTAKAILNACKDNQMLPFTKALAFSSSRKYSAVMLNDGRTYVLGAREFLPHKINKIDEKFIEYEKQGYRVLLLGYSKIGLTENDKMPEVTPVAIVVLEDHIKEDAVKNIEWFKNNGVTIKIISGDNPLSVAEIAKRVGVLGTENYISLEAMPIEEVKAIANKYTVFGRVSPEQKEALISAMQSEDHVVAMTGDGVNDILALKVADCSIAMASGSDAAKSVAHIVSMDSNFSALPDVVKEGRRVINNLQRTCSIFLIKTIFAMILTIIFLISSWAGGSGYPFVGRNLFIWELLTIGFASFFLSLQPNDERIKNSFFANIITKSLPGAIIQIIFTMVYFIISAINPSFLPFNTAVTMAIITFTSISFITLLIISWPFDAYRKVLSIGIGIIMVGFFIIDRFCVYNTSITATPNNSGFFNIDYNTLANSNWWIIFIVIALAIPAYIFMSKLALYIQNKFFNKEKKDENF